MSKVEGGTDLENGKAIGKDTPQWPFDVWLRLAVLHMHMTPHAFWAMSVRDWFTLCHRDNSAQFARSDLADLMLAFPDVSDAHTPNKQRT